jgi:3-deoxy-7-phosphoheptulonate synthase
VTKGGHSAIVSTSGNEDCHIILRGGNAPNYDRASVESACREAGAAALACRLMIDCSHGNSQKNPDNQLLVAQDIVDQLSEGEARIFGAMIESHLVAGREDLVAGRTPTYGRSITDGCLGWEATEQALEMLAEGVTERRIAMAQ